jgi:predicted NAD/FAD-binding protein
MKVAIIGGGAAGIITAYFLDKKGHEVTVFEKEQYLGGNIRTTNKNVTGVGPENHFLEGGVIEFSSAFHEFKALLDELEVAYTPAEIGTGLFFENGRSVLSPIMIRNNRSGWARIQAYTKFLQVQVASWPLINRFRKSNLSDLSDLALGDLLDDRPGAQWVKNLMMYSYSTPFERILDFPAALAYYNLQHYMRAGWFRIPGGVYSYVEKILERFSGSIQLGAQISEVVRNASGVELRMQDGQRREYDLVVFATTPEQVLRLLGDADVEEQTLFSTWKSNLVETVIHSDASIYDSYGITNPSEFDFFENRGGWAYNASLNQVCEIPSDEPYFLSFNLENKLAPDDIVARFGHQTPAYRVEALKTRPGIIQRNGENRTFFAGAWLYDGLHEGAVRSAMRVSDLIRDKVADTGND